MTTEQIITKITGLRSGAYFAYLVGLGQENAERWSRTHLDALAYMNGLTKKQIVEKLHPASELHERQLMGQKKTELIKRLWAAKMNAAARRWASENS